MRAKYSVAGLLLLGASLIGWATLALGQAGPGVYPQGKPITPAAMDPKPLLPPMTAAPITPLTPTSASIEDPSLALPANPGKDSPTMAPRPGVVSPQTHGSVPMAPIMPTEPVGPSPKEVPHEDRPVEAAPSVSPDNPLGRQEPAVSLEWVGPATAKIGQAADYSLVVRNICNIPVQKVVVQVRLPNGVKLVNSEPKCTVDNNVLLWDLGNLMSRQERNLQMKLQCQVKGYLMPQAWVTITGSSVTRILVREPKLILKAQALDKVLVGETTSFTLTVTNPGDGAAEMVKVHAVLSPGLECAKGKTDDFDIGSLAAGESKSVQVLCAAKEIGMQTCEASAEADGGLVGKDSCKVNVITPRLELSMHGPGLKYLDRHGIYTLKVANSGDASATNVSVRDVVPDGFKVLASSDGGRYDFGTRTVSWFLGEIGPGQSKEVKFEVQAINIGEYKHLALASGDRSLRAESALGTRVEGLSALMLELVDTEDPIEVGGETAYEVRVTNTGSKTETDIKMIATIPDKMELVKENPIKGPFRYRVEGKTIVFEPLEKLAPRADALMRISVKALEAGTVRFKIQMTSANLQEPVIKMEATRIYSDAPDNEKNSVDKPIGTTNPMIMPPGQ